MRGRVFSFWFEQMRRSSEPVDNGTLRGPSENIFHFKDFLRSNRPRKTFVLYVDLIRKSTWRSETEDALNCSGQFAIRFPERGQNESQAGSGPIPGIFPTKNKAMKTGLFTSATEPSSSTDKQDAFSRLCEGPKTGSPSAADWIAQIKRIWARGPASTLELARLICLIRHRLPRGEWTALWRSGEMPFGRRKGCHLRVIGEGLGWANVRVCARLPAGCRILYQLARLDRRTLERLIFEEVIRPTLKEWEAKLLVAQFRGETLKTRSARAALRERLRRLAEYFAANLADLSAEDQEVAEAQLPPTASIKSGSPRTSIRAHRSTS